MFFLLILFSACFLTSIYILGYFTLAIFLRIHNNHYFLREVTVDQQNRIGVITRTPIQYATKANSFGDAVVKEHGILL